ncbi:MAG: fibronectin type III domain-containing protein [Proteobacteria bacterium]|nr:fibronectin type III domain-containing protein [Pseudomonadota bacterium]
MNGGKSGTVCFDSSILRRFTFSTGRVHLSLSFASAVSFLLIISLPLFTGCGKKGPPLPKNLVIPEGVKSFSIEGRVEGLLISWQNPEKNSDGTILTDLAGYKLHKREDSENCKRCPSDFPIYMDVDLASAADITIEGGRTYLLDWDVKADVDYQYKVAPYNRGGYFGLFSETKNGRWRKPLSGIKDLKAEAGDRTVKLTWQAFDVKEDDGFVGYRVYRRDASGSYGRVPVSASPLKETRYTDIGLENDSQYYYIVKSLSQAGDTLIESEPSEEVPTIPRDMSSTDIPQNVNAEITDKEISLSWDKVGEGEGAGYNIFRKVNGDLAMVKLNKTPLRDNHYLDADIRPGKRYVYTITSVDPSARHIESAPSAEVIIRVPE